MKVLKYNGSHLSNVITSRETDYPNENSIFIWKLVTKSYRKLGQYANTNQVMILSTITLSGFQCTVVFYKRQQSTIMLSTFKNESVDLTHFKADII